jgi:hypothetical protein
MMAVTLTVAGPRPEMLSFCNALETVLLSNERYSFMIKGIDNSHVAYLIKEDGDEMDDSGSDTPNP